MVNKITLIKQKTLNLISNTFLIHEKRILLIFQTCKDIRYFLWFSADLDCAGQHSAWLGAVPESTGSMKNEKLSSNSQTLSNSLFYVKKEAIRNWIVHQTVKARQSRDIVPLSLKLFCYHVQAKMFFINFFLPSKS